MNLFSEPVTALMLRLVIATIIGGVKHPVGARNGIVGPEPRP